MNWKRGNIEDFKIQVQGEPYRPSTVYVELMNRWFDYYQRTEHLTQYQATETRNIHQELFGAMPGVLQSDEYKETKKESRRLYDQGVRYVY